MAAGISDKLRDVAWIVDMIDAAAPKPGPRGPYKQAKAIECADYINSGVKVEMAESAQAAGMIITARINATLTGQIVR